MNIDDVIARAQITDVIYRYCRGLDRMDKALTLSCWHPGGTDDHGRLYAGSAEGFVEWVWPVHEQMIATRHMITNIQIELDGDQAGSEAYASLILRVPLGGEVYDCFFQSRYLDRFERIDGEWKIRHRMQVRDFARYERLGASGEPPDGPPLIEPSNPNGVGAQATREETDPSFAVLYGAARWAS
jgi:hypothetical protein